MESPSQKPRDWDDYVVGFPMVMWAASFFFPALIGPKSNWIFPGTTPGYEAALGSLLALVALLVLAVMRPPTAPIASLPKLGDLLLIASVCSLWLANVWMLLAPAMSKRIRRGEGRFYLVTLWLWVFAPLPIPIRISAERSDFRGTKLAIGFYVWWASFLLLAILCTNLHLRSRQTTLEPYPQPPAKM